MTEHSNGSFFVKPSGRTVDDYQALIDRDYPVTVSRWVHAGWDIFKKNAGVSIAAAVLGGIVMMILSGLIPGIGLIVYYPIIGGFIIAALLFYRNKEADFSSYLQGFRYFLPLLVFSIVSTVFIAIGTFLLVVPGIYLTVAYLFSPCLIVDRNLDFWPAMEISRKKVNKHWFGLFGFSIVIVAINLLGCIPLFLGLFITVPLSINIITAAYRDIFSEGETQEENIQPVAP